MSQLKLSDVIQSLRMDFNITRSELARRSKLTIPTLANIENKDSSPSLANLDRIGASFGVPGYYLLILMNEDSPFRDAVQRELEYVRSMPPENQVKLSSIEAEQH